MAATPGAGWRGSLITSTGYKWPLGFLEQWYSSEVSVLFSLAGG